MILSHEVGADSNFVHTIEEMKDGREQERPVGLEAWAGNANKSAKRNFWLFLVCFLFTIQAGLLWTDHRPMFFLGDSESYIWTALSGWLPPDRSFLYGYFIRLLAVNADSLTFLVIAQVLLSCISSIVMAHLLIRYLGARRWVAFSAALLASLEPLQLLYTRYVMTETLGLAIFVFYLWTALHYLEDPRIRWLGLMHCIATLLLGIRLSFIPVVWIFAVTAPFLAFSPIALIKVSGRGKPIYRLALHVVISLFFLSGFTAIYKHLHGHLQHKPPAYSYHGGFFALSFVFPLLEAHDFSDEALGHKVLSDLRFPLTDRRSRGPHHWMEGGVVARLKEMEPNQLKADAIARHAAFHAVIHKPFAFLRLGWQTFADYFDGSYLRRCIETDLGNHRLEDDFQTLLNLHFDYPRDRSSALDLKTPTGKYFLHSARWFQVLLFLPMGWGILLLFLKDGVQRRLVLLLGLISTVSIGMAVFLVERPTPRYLHTAAWIFFLMLGLGFDRLLSWRKHIECVRMAVQTRDADQQNLRVSAGRNVMPLSHQ